MKGKNWIAKFINHIDINIFKEKTQQTTHTVNPTTTNGLKEVQISQQQLVQAAKTENMNKVTFCQHQKQCPICLTTFFSKDFSIAFECKHQYCHNCLSSYIGQKLKAFAEVLCPDESCKKPLDKNSQFFNSLSPQDKRKCQKIQKLNFVNNDNYLKLCPMQGCEGIMSFIKGQTIFCPTCGLIFCQSCLNPIHDGECEANEVEFLQQNMQYKRCSQCRHVLERTQGCNHMTCVCRYEFCYVCGQKWTGSHMSCRVGKINETLEKQRERQRQRSEQEQIRRMQQQNMQMAKKYGTVDEYSMEELLKISQNSLYEQIHNQHILDEEIEQAIQISMMGMIPQEKMGMENHQQQDISQIIFFDQQNDQYLYECKENEKMTKHQI